MSKPISLKDFEALVRREFGLDEARSPNKPRPKTRAQIEYELQNAAADEHLRWWIEQNRLDAMRRGE